MKYAEHTDPHYDSKTAAGCEEAGEPTFLLRAQDKYAAYVVRRWSELVENGEMAEQAIKISDAMDQWGKENGVKEPDL